MRTRRPQPRRRKGFTLMEVLLVMAILVILASMATVAILNRKKGADADAAKLQIKLLKTAANTYYLDVGMYPTTSQGLAALEAAPSDLRDPSRWRGPYLDQEVPPDPWGNPYQYEASGSDQLRIWSWGPDGQNATADDVAG